jgi:hypothetical protein
MRENPWHIRVPNTEHYQSFKNLIDLHELTTGWLKEIQLERPSYLLTRGLSKKVVENLWMLDSLSEKDLESFLDDTWPDEVISQLEHTVWAEQAWTLSHIQGKTTATSRVALETVLEQTSWKAGAINAQSRWSVFSKRDNLDLKDILLALNDSPFSGYPRGNGFLIRRSIPSEIQVELRICPHQIHFPEVKSVADRLCRLHAHWMRGFAYFLNNKVIMEHVVQSPRCTQRWSFM